MAPTSSTWSSLTKRRGTLIRHLSGGQVKRASLANELMSRPSLLFLDEVTSGLDEQTDREMMELFRQVADGGKTVVCITHSLANVEATCHLVVILTEGGRLAFVGTPDEAKAYFGMTRLGDVYQKLAERTPVEEWLEDAVPGQPVLHPLCVADRMPVGRCPIADDKVTPRPLRRQATRRASRPPPGVDPDARRYVAIWRRRTAPRPSWRCSDRACWSPSCWAWCSGTWAPCRVELSECRGP